MTATTILYRPIGQKEHDLIEQTGWSEFPPRLSHQPIFYPVLQREYAVQIARDWNTQDPTSDFVGYVTEFEVETDFLSKYPVQQAGSLAHQEYWIPADELDSFNSHIHGRIKVIAHFQGPQTEQNKKITS